MDDRKEAAARAFRMSLRDVRDRVQNAMLLAGAAMFVSYPMFYYQFGHLMGSVFKHVPTARQLQLLSVGQSLILFALALPCALVGFLYGERLSLPGFGKLGDLKKWLPAALLLGLALTLPWYWLTDRALIAIVPAAYPRPWPWAIGWIAGNALSQEVIARFGLLSIGVYLLRWRGFSGHPWPAIAIVSVFATSCSFLFFERIHPAALIGAPLCLASLGTVFLTQWALGEAYVRKGLTAALALHLGLEIRLIVYSLIF